MRQIRSLRCPYTHDNDVQYILATWMGLGLLRNSVHRGICMYYPYLLVVSYAYFNNRIRFYGVVSTRSVVDAQHTAQNTINKLYSFVMPFCPCRPVFCIA